MPGSPQFPGRAAASSATRVGLVWGAAGGGGRVGALAGRPRKTKGPRRSEPLVLVQEEFWCGWCPPTGCEVMRPTGSQDETRAHNLDLGNARSVRSGR